MSGLLDGNYRFDTFVVGSSVSLAAAVTRTRQIEGAKQLARMLGIDAMRGGR